MWIVRVALQRPYTFIMLAVLIVLMGGYAILKTATDIFPNIKIPIAAVIWRYNGILPEEIANRIVLFSERIAQTTVNDVEHTESQSLAGTSVVKFFFQPNVNEELSFAQITAVSQTNLRSAPPGTTPCSAPSSQGVAPSRSGHSARSPSRTPTSSPAPRRACPAP